MELLIAVVCVFAGYALANLAQKAQSIGTLKVITDDEREPYLFVELNKDIYYVNDYLANSNYAIFEIQYYGDAPHE